MAKDVLFNSVFADDIMGFISEKQALGYKYAKGTSQLKLFDEYVCNCSVSTMILTKEIVLEWTKRSPYESKSTHRHLILPMIIRMLYCCGLRLSEATHLNAKNVDLEEGTLYIKGTKFGKERLIPMSDNLTKICRNYIKQVLDCKANDTYFFPSPYGGHYENSTIYGHFRKIIWEAGISHTGKGPRLHDLRHTFAVHCLKKWVLNGKDLTNCLPYLSVYLGHEDLRGTQHYLRLTADLYPDIIKKVEQSCSWMIPEVTADETD